VNLASSLARSARDHAERTVIRFGDAAMTYRELDERSGRVAGLLRELGFQAGDRVGVMLPNVPEFAVAYYGVLRAGGVVVVPMNPLLKAREVAYYLGDSGAQVMLALAAMADEAQAGSITAGARTVVVDDDFGTMLASAPLVDEVVDRDGSDTAVILYTSGTTGQPKGAELTHDNMRRNAEVYVANLVQLTSDDVTFGGLPLFHSFGQTCCLNATVAAGAGLTLLPRFDPAHALRTIAEHGATVFAGVPTMYGALLGVPERKDHDTSAMRVCVSGGSALPLEVLRAFDKSFGCKILEGYGLSETSPVASFNHPDRPRKAGSIGTPIEGVQMRVVDESGVEVAQGEVGEIAIRGHNVMKGYWRRPADTAAAIPDGWFRSGDLGRMDEDGYFFIVDRKKDMIISGGYNVYPREIEEVLYEHPAVAEAAVIGLPDPLLGEEVAAVVVLKGGAATTVYELREHVKSQVAGYKYPTARVVRRHPAQGADRQDPQAGHPRPGRPEHAMTSPDGGPTDRADPAAPDARPVTAARSPLDFRDRTVFVAGGTSGINLGIAEGFAAAGARVAVMSRKPAKAGCGGRSTPGAGRAVDGRGRRRPGRRGHPRGTHVGARGIRGDRRAGLRGRRKLPGHRIGHVAQRLSFGGRDRPARHLSCPAQRPSVPAQTRRGRDQHLGPPGIPPVGGAVPCLRGEGRRRHADPRPGHRMGCRRSSRQRCGAGPDRRHRRDGTPGTHDCRIRPPSSARFTEPVLRDGGGAGVAPLRHRIIGVP
jgi:long-chain acyl-CoA synthetase